MKKLYFQTAVVVYCISLVVLTSSCTKLEPKAPALQDAMNAPLDGLTQDQYRLFNMGAEEFDETYISSTGLGPMFVSTSCASCHSDDNRGHPFTMLTRFGQSDSTGNQYLQLGGPQLQHRSLPGYPAETLPGGAPHAKFIAPIVAGLGFLELVPDADLVAMSDPTDLDGDGISGRLSWNYVPTWVTPNQSSITNNGKYICRFGRKAATHNIFQQTVQAFHEDMGVTSSFLPHNLVHNGTPLPPVPTDVPEVKSEDLMANVFYLQVIQKPEPRNTNNPNVIAGKQLFIAAGCEKCHRETLKTGSSPIVPLSEQLFHPYTDLLLHDMGPELDDGYTEGFAGTAEWRTTPLWGLGLAKDAQGGKLYLLHDGRAGSIEEAILWHGGESQSSKEYFLNMNQNQRKQLIEFLNSL